jgi:tRNA(fMet)-specific endonuclease VapC
VSGKYLLDTNIIIALFADEAAVKSNLAQAEEVFIPSIAIGELCYGARKSRRSKENLERIDELVANTVSLGCDTETARYYGEVKDKLRLKGRPLPENDIWIAALALQHNLTLVTRDAHFQEVEHLK